MSEVPKKKRPYVLSTVVLLAGALALSGGVPPSGARAAGAEPIAQLRAGQSTFWTGPHIDQAAGLTSETCALPGSSCLDYTVTLLEPGELLRVALDHPSGTDSFLLELYDPSGKLANSTQDSTTQRLASFAGSKGEGTYSMEVSARQPVAGTWRIRVLPVDATDTFFRMRAKLERVASKPVKRELLPPNLRITPPFDFTFRAPAPQDSCLPGERQENQAVRCLRFSTGPENIERGPLDLHFRHDDLTTLDPTRGTVFQRLWYSRVDSPGQPAYLEAAVGRFTYHKEHMHYHHDGLGQFTLLRVIDRTTGELEQVGQGPKQGFCMSDYLIAEWDRFYQGQQHLAQDREGGPNCGLADPALGTSMGLSAGWGDVYGWYLAGNYVDFRANPDGEYVVRVSADSAGELRETVDTDNVSYAYITVGPGDQIQVHERGYGLSPWDPAKVLSQDIRLPLAERSLLGLK